MKFSKSLIFLFCVVFSTEVFAAPPKDCADAMEDLRQKQSARLVRLDKDFRTASWEYRKYQETVYTPLWQSALQKNDRYSSKEKRAEGEVAFERYRHFADTARDNAHKAYKAIQLALDGLETGLPRDFACRLLPDDPHKLTSDFRNCMEIFTAETEDRLVKLRRVLSKYYEDQEAFSEMVETHVTDNPSDHDTFEDRYRDFLFNIETKTISEFLKLSLDLQDRFEKKWPGEECCRACLADKTAGQDPVLSQTKVDPQGAAGVAGQMVNNARLTDAFKRFDEEAEKPGGNN